MAVMSGVSLEGRERAADYRLVFGLLVITAHLAAVRPAY